MAIATFNELNIASCILLFIVCKGIADLDFKTESSENRSPEFKVRDISLDSKI